MSKLNFNKCAPSNDNRSFTCYSKKELIEIAKLYNKENNWNKINIKNIVRSKGQNAVSDANDELYALCRKYDRSGEPKVMPAFEKVMDAYWSYLDF